jgi:hypothetical protein
MSFASTPRTSRTKLIAVGEPFDRLEFDARRIDNE